MEDKMEKIFAQREGPFWKCRVCHEGIECIVIRPSMSDIVIHLMLIHELEIENIFPFLENSISIYRNISEDSIYRNIS